MARPGFRNHPKFKRAMRILGEPAPHVLGYCECLWTVAYECGNPIIGDETDVELAAEYPGTPGKLLKALMECGGPGKAGLIEAVDGEPGRYQIHDLFDHAPEYVTKRARREINRGVHGKTISEMRAEAGRKGAASRWNKELESQTDDVCHDDDGKWIANGGTPAPAPAPAPAPIGSRESNTLLGDARSRATPPAAGAALTFPVKGNSPPWVLPDEQLVEYEGQYPNLDVGAEMRRARQWLIDNPGRRKTPAGMLRYLSGWLKRTAERFGDGPQQDRGQLPSVYDDFTEPTEEQLEIASGRVS